MRMIGACRRSPAGRCGCSGMDPGHRRARDPGPARRGAAGGHARPRADRPREPPASTGATSGCPRRAIRERADELLDFVQLTERANDQVDPLSGGMKRRLTIARSLINEPELLLLDEPTTGLDPQARHVLWDRLYRLKQRGVTLVLTTHYMDEAEQLCDRLVVMDKARIVAEGSPRAADRASTPRREVRRAAASSPATHEADGPRSSRTSPSGSRCCPTACCSTSTTATRRSAAVHDRGLAPASACWCAAARWRTSSSASPAGRWSTDDDPTLAAPRAACVRVLGCTATGGPGAASVVSSCSTRCCSCGAWASASARWSTAATRAASAASRTSSFIAPGLLAATAMQIGRRRVDASR